MKTPFKILFTIILLLAISNLQAQSHTFAPGWCKLAKAGGVKGESAILECQVCNAKDKKEIEAKVAENKRRDDAIVAKAKAEREAFENARLEKLRLAEAEAKRIKNEKVVIDFPKNQVDNKKNEQPKSNKIYGMKKENYFYNTSWNWPNIMFETAHDALKGDWSNARKSEGENGLILNGKSIFNNGEFFQCIALNDPELVGEKNYEDYKCNFPPNIAIVILNELMTSKISSKKFHIVDLINEKGERLLKDNTINQIIHFADDYFIIFRHQQFELSIGPHFNDAYIYNIKTKLSYPIVTTKTQYPTVHCKTRTNLGGDDGDLLSKGTYKAYFITEIFVRKWIAYYITNEGTIKEQEFGRNF
jgi:hypothetical protein